jgi:DNA-binding transcriptional regulator YhcF (GntR family)
VTLRTTPDRGIKAKKVLHEPRISTVMAIERAILNHEDYPTRMELWNSLPKKVQYQTFQRALQYLESHGIIATDEEGKIFYTGVNSQKLRELLESSVPTK